MMEVIIQIMVNLISSILLIYANEEKNNEDSRSVSNDYSSIELVPSLKTGKLDAEVATAITLGGIVDADDLLKSSELNNLYNNENVHMGGFAAFLRDASSDDELYKLAKLNIQSKDVSDEEQRSKEDKKAEPEPSKEIDVKARSSNEKYITAAKSSPEESEKISAESKTSTEILRNKAEIKSKVAENSKESDKSAVDKEEDKKASPEFSNEKASKTATSSEKHGEHSRTPASAKVKTGVDDMDDLIYPYELEKYKKNDDDDYDKVLYSERQSSREREQPVFTGLAQDYRQNRRLFGSAPVLDYKGKINSKEIPDQNFRIPNRQRPFIGAGLPMNNFNNFPPALFTMRPPPPYLNGIRPLPNLNNIPNLRFNNRPYPPYYFPSNWGLPRGLPSLQSSWDNSREILNNPYRMSHSQEIFNNRIRWNPSYEPLNPPIRWRESKEIQDSSEQLTFDLDDLPPDSNAYPYVSPKLDRMDPNINSILRKLPPQSPIIPQKPFPIFPDTFRYPPLYRFYDPRLNFQRNFNFISRNRRFSIGNSFEMPSACCY